VGARLTDVNGVASWCWGRCCYRRVLEGSLPFTLLLGCARSIVVPLAVPATLTLVCRGWNQTHVLPILDRSA
jgi:hypothetical protein